MVSDANYLQPDAELSAVADYVTEFRTDSEDAFQTARLCLMDSLGCALLALEFPACTRLLGPVVPGATLEHGARVPGTAFELDPVQAAFNIGCMIRWLDFNDTWLAAEWGHPSDNLGGLLAIADYLSRTRRASSQAPLKVRDLLIAMIKAYEIQGVLALDNSFNKVGLDHVILVRVATAAVLTHLLGGTHEQGVNAVSNAWLDGGALRTYRHEPNTGTRKSWAAGDATARGVRLALLAVAGEMGYPTALSAQRWGFADVVLAGQPLQRSREYGSCVMENILFKVAFPAEFHGQTAVEAALRLHPAAVARLDDVERVVIETQSSALRIIDKRGPLRNPADRDHCLQYMTAVGLIFGRLDSTSYDDATAADPRIDTLRDKMDVQENASYSADYLDPAKRSIGNAVQVFFKDGTQSDRIEVEYPLGHRRRREEALPQLMAKFERNAGVRLPAARCARLLDLFSDARSLDEMAVDTLVDLTIM